MDPWKESAALQECRDAVRQWAELEGKSAQMAEDLVRDQTQRAGRSVGTHMLLGAGVRLFAWFVETWWYLTRR
jgi:hypothetical protein